MNSIYNVGVTIRLNLKAIALIAFCMAVGGLLVGIALVALATIVA